MFVKEEIAGKKAGIRKLMAELGLDGILVKKIANFAWLTGGGINYVGITTDTGVSSILITPDREYLVSNNIEATRLEQEELLVAQGYEPKIYPWHRDAGEAEAVKAIMGTHRLGSDCGYPGSLDVNARLAELRYSLTSWEVERYRELGRLTSIALEETAMEIRPGDRECAVVGRLAARLWADRIDYLNFFCAADDRIARFRHPLATERKIDRRVMLCVNSRRHGLILTVTRFVQFGKVDAELRKKYNDAVNIDCQMIANTVPGRPIVDAFNKGMAAYKDLGYDGEYELHNQGGPIGYMARDARVHWQTPGLVHENQGFSWNPSITGAKSEDVMLATSRGAEMLTYPVLFPKLEMEAEGQRLVRPDILEA